MMTESIFAATWDQEHNVEVGDPDPGRGRAPVRGPPPGPGRLYGPDGRGLLRGSWSLGDGDYGLALLRGGQPTELTDSGRLDDYGITETRCWRCSPAARRWMADAGCCWPRCTGRHWRSGDRLARFGAPPGALECRPGG